MQFHSLLTIKVWCGKGWYKGKYNRCVVSDYGSFKNEDISVFIWDSDSGKIDIEAILEVEDFNGNIKEMPYNKRMHRTQQSCAADAGR